MARTVTRRRAQFRTAPRTADTPRAFARPTPAPYHPPPPMTSATKPDFALIAEVTRRAFAHMVAMIHVANHRDDADKTDPKVGGHPAACAACLL